MLKFGFALSSEDHSPSALVQFARQAEEAGCEFALISDHFHPWVEAQEAAATAAAMMPGGEALALHPGRQRKVAE